MPVFASFPISTAARRVRAMASLLVTAPLLALGVLSLGGCGERTDLKPKLAHQLPMPPYGRPDRANAHELLTPSSQARPANTVELRIKSEPRLDDPFDLPPKD